MEWVAALSGQVVGLDTAPLIYFIEENPVYLETIRPFFVALDRGDLQVVTSTVTLLEVLVHPLRRGERELAQQYRDILIGVKGLATISLTLDIAEEAARLRACYSIRTPDAIQIATVLRAGATCFITNDTRFPLIPGLSIIILDELKAKSRLES
ncbi:MAG: type II toxin-antitoxin system VapC family toxin [Anaerolineae bacterium]